MGRRYGVLGDAGSRNPGRRPRVPASSFDARRNDLLQLANYYPVSISLLALGRLTPKFNSKYK